MYRSKQTPRVSPTWLQYADLFDLSGFAPSPPPPSIIEKRRSSNTNTLSDPQWGQP